MTKLTGIPGHVTIDAQNRPKLGRRRQCWSHVPAGGAQRREARKQVKMTGSTGHVTAQNRPKLGCLRMCQQI
jgi:hypothetical protein